MLIFKFTNNINLKPFSKAENDNPDLLQSIFSYIVYVILLYFYNLIHNQTAP